MEITPYLRYFRQDCKFKPFSEIINQEFKSLLGRAYSHSNKSKGQKVNGVLIGSKCNNIQNASRKRIQKSIDKQMDKDQLMR